MDERDSGLPPSTRDTWPVPRELALAREAIDLGWTRERVVQALHARIRRDEQYLAYRRSRGFYTPTDEAIAGDLRALALAAYALEGMPDWPR
jgi:hypothetical protein